MKFKPDQKYIDEGLIAVKEHPNAPYLIYNYTQTAQFSRAWDDVVMKCRGIIVHKETDEVLAHPFPKFFNYEEHKEKGFEFPKEIPKVYTKLDGSLGILYWIDGTPHIATRGSFTSEQALWATKHIQYFNTSKLDKKFTYLFEIIYPSNRIVVNYDFSGLVLLAKIDTETGKSVPLNGDWHLEVSSHPFTSYEELKALNEPNNEGFVLHFEEADFRVKIKFEDYVRLHKIMTGLSEIGIWELLREGKNPCDQENVPDEMFSWIKEVSNRLFSEFYHVRDEAWIALEEVAMLETRKEKAMHISKSKYPSVTFAMLDGKDYEQIIWKMVRPRGLTTFREDIDQ